MLRYLFLFMVLSGTVPAAGQVMNGKISGSVTDSLSNSSLELATISIFSKDSALINYQLSDRDGNFAMAKLPLNRDLRLDVSFVGYKSYKQHFRLDSINSNLHFRIALSVNLADSNAIVIKSIVPIRMNGDTLEINPAAFKMEKTAVAEELLNQVPGITIWADGTITVNGRAIPKILVDGKPFLNQTDPTIATQNLPKSAIEKIQVYQEIDRTREQRDNSPQDSILTMNIKLKADKKTGYFGKAGAGYGTDDRYESDAAFQLYNKKNSLAIGGGINNVNKSIGSLQQSLKNNTFRNVNPNLGNVSSFGRNGIFKSYSLGLLYTHDFITSENGSSNETISPTYTNTGSNNFLESNTIQERTTREFSQLIESRNRFNSDSRGNQASVSYNKSRGYNSNFNVNTNGNLNDVRSVNNNFTSVKDSAGDLQSTNETNSVNHSRSSSAGINMQFSNYDQANPLTRFNSSASVNINSSRSDRNTTSMFDSYTDPAADKNLNRLYNNNVESMNINLTLNYMGLRRLLFRRFNLFGTEMSLYQEFSFDQNKNNAIVNDYDSATQKFTVNNGLTNNNKLQTLRYTPGVSFQKNFNKWTTRSSRSFSLSLRLGNSLRKENNSSSLAMRNIERSFSFFTPSFGASHGFSKKDKLMYNVGVNVGRNYSYPSVDQLYTIIDSINLYSVRIGNPNLKNTRTDNASLNLSVNKTKPKAKFDINGGLNGSVAYRSNPVADSIINDASGKRIVYYINAKNGITYGLNYSANISKKIKKNMLQLQYGGNATSTRTTNFIDGLATDSRSTNLTHNINFQFALKTVLIVRIAEVISTYSSSQSAGGLASYKITNKSTQLGATWNHSKNLSFNTTISTNDNSNISQTIILWHAFGSYRFLKGKEGELKLSAFDLLKKFQNLSTTANVDGTSTTITNGLQQYFLLTFSYYPRKFGKKNTGD